MAIGEPPNRRKTRKKYPTKNNENAVLEWMKATLMGLSGGLLGAADMPGNAARNAGSFLPASTLTATGSPAAAVEGVNRASADAYERGATEADKVLLAASVVPAVGLRNIGRTGGRFMPSPDRVARQRARDLEKMRAGGADMRPIDPRMPDNPQGMVAAAEAAQRNQPREVVPPARFPSNRTPRTDAPRETTAVGIPKRELPRPPAAQAAEAVDDGPIKLNIPQALRGVDEASGKPKVRVTWSGDKEPNHQSFKKLDPETGKYVPWKEGFKQAKKRWKTRQTKSDVNNPNATQARVDQQVAEMTPEQYARYQVQRGVAADPEGAATAVGRANEPELAGIEDRRRWRGTMEEFPGYEDGARPRKAAKIRGPGQGADRARGPRPERQPGEKQADFDARLEEWAMSRSVANLRKSRASLRRPSKRKNESDAAYEKRLQKWRSSLDEGSEEFGSTRASQTLRSERARVDRKLAEAQPRRMEASDMPGPTTPASRIDTPYNPYATASRELPIPRAADPVDPLDLPRYTPTRGKGSTRLRNVRKVADESPSSNVADKPAEAVKKPSAKKSAKKTTKKSSKKSSAKKDNKKKDETVTDQDTATQAADERRVFAMRGRPAEARRGASTPLNRRPPDRIAPEGGFAMPRVPSRELVDPSTTRTGVSTPYTPPKPNPKPGRSTPMSERPEPKAPRGGFPGEGRKPATERGRKGYLTAAEERAIKDRAKNVKGRNLSRGQKFAVGTTAVAFPAAAAFSISQGMLQDAEKKGQSAQQVAEKAAEEAVQAEGKDKEPESKAARSVLRDKYGRKITREEYERREAYREKLKGMSEAEKKAARAKEMKRREKWRESIGKQLFGKKATKAVRNLDIREGISVRELNERIRAAGGPEAARSIRRAASRKKKD